ncbi:MAG: hypothetical protein ACYC2Z_05605 [Candidatus Nanopelagicales bacterium]
MTVNRSGYAVALVVAVLTLIGTVGLAVAYAPSGGWAGAQPYGAGSDGGWRLGWGAGMMGNGWSGGPGQPSLADGKVLADEWLASNRPGLSADSGTQTPMGLMFFVTRDGEVEGMLMLNGGTGQVYYWPWSGAVPTPAAS